MTHKPYNPETEGAQMSFAQDMSYTDYLHLDPILSAQHPLSAAEDELLFIIQHQTSELWMKLALHELGKARTLLQSPDARQAFKGLSRVARIFEQLNGAWDVLRTMTPSDYTAFRDALGQSSGFQSFQYRMIEFTLGNRNAAMIRPHAHRPDLAQQLEHELTQPSLYDVACQRLSAATGVQIPARNRAEPHAPDQQLQDAWRKVYEDPARYWDLYELAEKLVDLEDYFRRWRFNHLTTVERVIGLKRGTGGTGGAPYLKRMLETELFPDLWHLRTAL
ncbi:tryptophan 2,3-dioxygenase [Tropicibacter naphthalenivorans]|uniref:Tryptophan 2,3-dioxygenase n=1 Tax=Tropicibacter naphthalenivorans TaxID=441103 RepID=A0A0P1H0X2_9RHOB|nr:tryptophan 2,3-dioxygenase family protein [Tropicibacter naphthalenivorans]CUH80042.1 Tryptophan 2,3-dioxygenase [Tropicibacter naphthalenivorans]SMC83687.1 tryptophan 2,3-dioxygenase [Tropicibacter naphthalenivorans]